MTLDYTTPPPAGYVRDARGNLLREENISQRQRDEDAVVRHIHSFGDDLSDQMGRFKSHSMQDIGGHVDRVIGEYGGKIGGRHGNVTMQTIDGCRRVNLAQAQVIDVGPEIEAVHALIDECIEDWSRRSSLNLRALVDAALRPNVDGKVSVTALLKLRRVEIDDPRWQQVQAAISDALRPQGRAEYIRLYRRDDPTQPWQQVPLDLARVPLPNTPAEETAEGVLYRRVESAIYHAKLSGLKTRQIQQVLAAARQGNPLAPTEPETDAAPAGEAA